jgi:hypothetical protein
MKKFTSNLLVAVCALSACTAFAHIGLSNLTMPIAAGGQSTFAIANTTNEISFNVPHGCAAAQSVPTFRGNNLDTYKIEVTVPAAIVKATTPQSLRPALKGEFGAVTVGAVDASGNVKFTWTKKSIATDGQNYSALDNQLYKVSLRLKVPAVSSASDVSIKKYQFLTVQTCKDAAGQDVVMDWGSANSPKLVVFPEKRKGFNKFTLDATAASDFTGALTLSSPLKSYFGDSTIVWIGKAGYSANATTAANITSLIAKDSTYSDLGAKAGATVSTTDTFWVKY